MLEFEDKLNAILGDQNAMGQIMALAQTLSVPELPGEQDEQQELLLVPEHGGRERDVQLLSALRPYLKENRRKRLDRAIELLQLLRLIKGNRE